jgi:hypothetical protein
MLRVVSSPVPSRSVREGREMRLARLVLAGRELSPMILDEDHRMRV